MIAVNEMTYSYPGGKKPAVADVSFQVGAGEIFGFLGPSGAGKSTTIFLTTHNMQVADDLCGRVAFIVDGKITLIDTPRKLKLRNGKKSVRVEFRNNGFLQHSDFPLQKIGDNPRFSECLKDGNIETIHTLEATLEEVFLKTTGRSLA